jgi:hypothetical protein
VELQDEDGKGLLPRPVAHDITLPSNAAHPPGATDFGLVRSFTFNNLRFDHEGPYSFVIAVDDQTVSRVRFTVRERKSSGAQ